MEQNAVETGAALAVGAYRVMGEPMATWVPVLAMVAVLVWGAWLITAALRSRPGGSGIQGHTDGRSRMVQMLSEKMEADESTSFSRTAGAIGAFVLAAFFAGLGLWLLFALNDGDATKIDRLPQLATYILSGSALFAPYAFNQLARVFGVRPEPST